MSLYLLILIGHSFKSSFLQQAQWVTTACFFPFSPLSLSYSTSIFLIFQYYLVHVPLPFPLIPFFTSLCPSFFQPTRLSTPSRQISLIVNLCAPDVSPQPPLLQQCLQARINSLKPTFKQISPRLWRQLLPTNRKESNFLIFRFQKQITYLKIHQTPSTFLILSLQK